MDIDALRAAAKVVLDEEYNRVLGNMRNGWITPALASLLFEHFARGQELLINTITAANGDKTSYSLSYFEYCNKLNPNHSDTMVAYRTAKPSDLKA